MTEKITIKFNEIEGKRKETIKNILKKPYDQLTQTDLLDIRKILDTHRDLTWQEDEQYQMINNLLNKVLDSQLYRPMEQRTFIEFVIEIIYDWVDQNLEYDEPTFETIQVFDAYFADGTMTYNTHQTLNYIRTFWDEFHEEDLDYIEAKTVFERPENFFVGQSYQMAIRILGTIFEDQEVYNKQEFLDYIDNEFNIYEFSKLIY